MLRVHASVYDRCVDCLEAGLSLVTVDFQAFIYRGSVDSWRPSFVPSRTAMSSASCIVCVHDHLLLKVLSRLMKHQPFCNGLVLFSQFSSPVETYIENWWSLYISLPSTTGYFITSNHLEASPSYLTALTVPSKKLLMTVTYFVGRPWWRKAIHIKTLLMKSKADLKSMKLKYKFRDYYKITISDNK